MPMVLQTIGDQYYEQTMTLSHIHLLSAFRGVDGQRPRHQLTLLHGIHLANDDSPL